MKKMFIVMIVVAMAVGAACGKKKAPEAPKGGSDMTAPAGSNAGSGEGSAAGGGETPPPAN